MADDQACEVRILLLQERQAIEGTIVGTLYLDGGGWAILRPEGLNHDCAAVQHEADAPIRHASAFGEVRAGSVPPRVAYLVNVEVPVTVTTAVHTPPIDVH
jgi:hypothetical protein